MADGGFPAPHDGFCDLCSKPIAADDRVRLLDWSEWGHKTCVDARPVSIPLPPEPPRDRVVEAVDQDGTVVERWVWSESWGGGYWMRQSRTAGMRWPYLAYNAMLKNQTLRHRAAESGEQCHEVGVGGGVRGVGEYGVASAW